MIPPSVKSIWRTAWQNTRFRTLLMLAFGLLLLTLWAFPYCFAYIQGQEGIFLNDIILSHLPAHDVSLPIFSLIWGSGLLMCVRILKNPRILVVFVLAYVCVTALRFGCMLIFPLEPPANLIPIVDPLSNYFYGKGGYITKDLFFSGHTSTLFLICLCLIQKTDKFVVLLATLTLGFLLLVQHVHYTLDVGAAFPFTYLVWKLVDAIVEKTEKLHIPKPRY